MKIEHKVAFVTGGASGLGLAAVRSLVENGAKVGIADLNEEQGKQINLLFIIIHNLTKLLNPKLKQNLDKIKLFLLKLM